MSQASLIGWALTALGLLQTAGYLTGSKRLRGIAASTAASPLPIVFSDVNGLETFASEFTLDYAPRDPGLEPIRLTPKLYARLGGPYNRRNVYGAAISYGPRLPEPLWKNVLHYGFCEPAPVLNRFGISGPVDWVNVHLRTKTAGRGDEWDLRVECRR